ncbi:EPIDERMAL PATTERNING FACTOR-like protein 6 [Canna indica]|uniref:Epidermal patterning factor-like protein n=1 Tax=Canna indica TaxID=4628 RepID=A0AAQ3JSD4_9LILI|nr:EPIDERMAL PATTERNING FACTOR-like protein 6 [Canna indica]
MDLITRGKRRDGSASNMAAALLCCAVICLLSIYALFIRAHSGVGSLRSVLHVQAEGAGAGGGGLRHWRELSGGGPGSYPPLCTAKCGDCTPCNPVHVAVPPGRPVIEEYYPEAWRCKCGNKLYMP